MANSNANTSGSKGVPTQILFLAILHCAFFHLFLNSHPGQGNSKLKNYMSKSRALFYFFFLAPSVTVSFLHYVVRFSADIFYLLTSPPLHQSGHRCKIHGIPPRQILKITCNRLNRSPFNEIHFSLEILLFLHLWPQEEDEVEHINFSLSHSKSQ